MRLFTYLRIFCLLTIFLTLIFLGSVILAQEISPQVQSRLDKRVEVVKSWGTDPLIIEAVKAGNKETKTLNYIKQMDKKWIESATKSTPEIEELIQKILKNKYSDYLREFKKKSPEYAEIFVMDNQGANVAMSDKTSDYWQGDEDKFVRSFAGGAGKIFVDKPKFDASSKAFTVQVSVPVIDPETKKAIGAITAGVDINILKESKE